MKGLIIYRTITGSAECYAKWLQEETGFEAVPVSKVRDIRDYDILIIGSCIRMGSPAIGRWIKKNWPKLKGKKLVYYTTSAALKTDPELQNHFKSNFPEEICLSLPYFPLNGKMIFKEFKWLERSIINFAVKMTAKTDPEKAKLMARDFNRINRDEIRPIVEYIKS